MEDYLENDDLDADDKAFIIAHSVMHGAIGNHEMNTENKTDFFICWGKDYESQAEGMYDCYATSEYNADPHTGEIEFWSDGGAGLCPWGGIQDVYICKDPEKEITLEVYNKTIEILVRLIPEYIEEYKHYNIDPETGEHY